MQTYLAPLCALIGALLYALCANPKAAELGKYMFACGLLVTLFMLGGKPIHLP